jgi:hypothetical protein
MSALESDSNRRPAGLRGYEEIAVQVADESAGGRDLRVLDTRRKVAKRLRSVYFAACFSRRAELRGHATDLHRYGFVVTSRWLDSPAKLEESELRRDGRGAQVARMDLEDVQGADVCFAFTEPVDGADRGRGGRHTELGIALALGSLCVIVGPREHVFHCLPDVVHHPDWQSARTWLLCLSEAEQPAA